MTDVIATLNVRFKPGLVCDLQSGSPLTATLVNQLGSAATGDVADMEPSYTMDVTGYPTSTGSDVTGNLKVVEPRADVGLLKKIRELRAKIEADVTLLEGLKRVKKDIASNPDYSHESDEVLRLMNESDLTLFRTGNLRKLIHRVKMRHSVRVKSARKLEAGG